MPCDTITTVTLKLKPEIVRIDLFVQVLRKLGHTQIQVTEDRVTWRTGVWERRGDGMLTERSKEVADKIRQTYASELTRTMLGRAGWRVRTQEVI